MLTPRSCFLKTFLKESFSKPFLTLDEQIDLLKSRGMLFRDESKAKYYIENLNYYRLVGYWLIFEEDHTSHTFKENTYFEDILDLYIFDRELRLLLLDAIERIEVSIRSKLAYYLAESFGSHALLKPDIFLCALKYSKTLDKLKSEIDRNSAELFIKHHFEKYKEELPPIWVCVEVMTLGQISNWLSNIKERKYRQIIAKSYGLDEKILCSFLHHLTIIRNACAHHSRVWNKRFPLAFSLPKNPNELNKKFNTTKQKYLYNTLVMCEYLMSIICEDTQWSIKLDNLIKKYSIDRTKMGYFED